MAPGFSFSLFLLLFFVTAALLCFVAAIPALDFGYWRFSTAPRVVMYCAAAGAGLVLGWRLARAESPRPAPPLVALLVFVVAALLFSGGGGTSLQQNLLGPFYLGDGGAWWIAVAIIAYGAFSLVVAGAGRLLLAIVAGAVLLDVSLNLAGVLLGAPVGTHFLADPVGWSVLCLLLVVASLWDGSTRLIWSLILLAVLIAFATDNRTLGLVCVLAAPVIALRAHVLGKITIILIFMAVIMMPLSVLFLMPAEHSALEIIPATVSDRIRYWNYILDRNDFHAYQIFFGHGFDEVYSSIQRNTGFKDVFQIHGPLLFVNDDVISETFFTVNAHNLFVELMHSSGLVIFAFFCLVFFAIIRRAMKVGHPAGALWAMAMVYGSLWYLVPANAPVFAVAIGASCAVLWARPAGESALIAGRLRYSALAAALTASAVLFYATQHEIRLARSMNAAMSSLLFAEPDQPAIQAALRLDPGGDSTSRLLFAAIEGVLQPGRQADQPRDPAPAHWGAMDAIWPELRQRMDEENPPGRLAAADLIARGHLLTSPDAPADIPAERAAWIREGWLERALAFIDVAPGRSDLLSPPLADLFARGETQALSRGARAVLARRPDDPVGLWFLGLARLQADDDRVAAFRMMARALDLGLADQFPVPETLAQTVRAGAGR